MILAAFGGRGNGKKMLRGWQGPKAGRGTWEVGGGEDGQEGGGMGRGGWQWGRETGRGNLEGGNEGRGRQGGGIWKEATRRGRWEGSNRDGKRVAMVSWNAIATSTWNAWVE